MIIAGWILAILGLAQVVYAGTIDVSQLIDGNRLLGIAPSVVANPDLVGQRGMIHQSGLATFLAGAVFLSAAYLKPAPQNPSQKSWSTVGAVAAGSLAVAAAIGFGLLIYALHDRNADLRLVTDMRIKAARAESNQRQWEEVDRRLAAEAAAAEDGAE